ADVDNPALTDESGDIATLPGLPDRFVITPLAPTVAGDGFGIRIEAVDVAGNTSTNYHDNVSLTVSVAGASQVPQAAWLGGAAQLSAYQTLMSQYTAGKVRVFQFGSGIAEIPQSDAEEFQFFFSDETPVIKVSTNDNSIQGQTDPLTI